MGFWNLPADNSAPEAHEITAGSGKEAIITEQAGLVFLI
jgi:hypothetical protein